MKPGVFAAEKKDGTKYFRAALTYKNKKISLASYETEELAGKAYETAVELLRGTSDMNEVLDNTDGKFDVLPFKKRVVLVNFRDNGMYIKTPVYLREKFFYYYFSAHDYLTFDSDDLFYYSTHSIMRRGGHYFVSDFGMQVNILSRYGIKNYAVPGKDYLFANGDSTDFRYGNIMIINRYHGVSMKEKGHRKFYEVKIHVNGDLLVGRYDDENIAAVAYNKAAKSLVRQGLNKNFPLNYIEEYDTGQYLSVFEKVKINKLKL